VERAQLTNPKGLSDQKDAGHADPT